MDFLTPPLLPAGIVLLVQFTFHNLQSRRKGQAGLIQSLLDPLCAKSPAREVHLRPGRC